MEELSDATVDEGVEEGVDSVEALSDATVGCVVDKGVEEGLEEGVDAGASWPLGKTSVEDLFVDEAEAENLAENIFEDEENLTGSTCDK